MKNDYITRNPAHNTANTPILVKQENPTVNADIYFMAYFWTMFRSTFRQNQLP